VQDNIGWCDKHLQWLNEAIIVSERSFSFGKFKYPFSDDIGSTAS
jgi:hypothetical protein